MPTLLSTPYKEKNNILSDLEAEDNILIIRAHLKSHEGKLVWCHKQAKQDNSINKKEENITVSSFIVINHHEETLAIHSGEWSIQWIPLFRIAKLLAFIDATNIFFIDRERQLPPNFNQHFIFPSVWAENENHIDGQIVSAILSQELSLNRLWATVRAHESYWIICHLLSEMKEGSKVEDIRHQYGVSSSHFRRLCKRYLGTNAKGLLRSWRASLSALQVIESEKSLSHIAANNGYASSSHFAKDIKFFLV